MHTHCTTYTEKEQVTRVVTQKRATVFVSSNHNTCCLCKKNISQTFGTVSCNQQRQGCLNQAHARCAGYRKRQASRVTAFVCPNHMCCLCKKGVIQDNAADSVSCKEEHRGCLNRAHVRCVRRVDARGGLKQDSSAATFTCPSHSCCLCKQDIILDRGSTVSCRRQHQGCFNQAHARCAPKAVTTFACPSHKCCLCERYIDKDHGTVSCKQRYNRGCLNLAHARCAGYTKRRASRAKQFSCPSCTHYVDNNIVND